MIMYNKIIIFSVARITGQIRSLQETMDLFPRNAKAKVLYSFYYIVHLVYLLVIYWRYIPNTYTVLENYKFKAFVCVYFQDSRTNFNACLVEIR